MAAEVMDQITDEPRLTRRAAPIEEFWALPESVLPTEYINGEIIMAPAPFPLHQRTVGKIFFVLTDFVLNVGGGEVFISPLDVILPSGDVVQPDVFFLKSADLKRGLKERIRAVPSLAVEVLSPGSVSHDTLRKRNLYERNGVREYWVVDSEVRSIAQLVLRKKHYALTELAEGDTIKSTVLTSFEMRVGELLGLGTA